jgi:hypothetical protein
MLKKKSNIEQTDKKLMYMVGIFFLFLILGIWLSTNLWYQIIMIVYFLIIFIFTIITVILNMKKLKDEAPFDFFSNLLAVAFIAFPLSLVVFGKNNNLSDSVKSFYTIAVGIGVNYVIDSVFKFVESEVAGDKKKLLTKKAAFNKILFNIIYISEYISFILIEYLPAWFDNVEQHHIGFINTILELFCQSDYWLKLFIVTVIILLILIAIVIIVMESIRKEVNNEKEDDIDTLRKELSSKLNRVSKIRVLLKNMNTDIDINLEKMEHKLNIGLNELNKIDK